MKNEINQVRLCGRVTIPEKIHICLTTHGKIMYFELKTCELWNHGTRKHFEYHNIVLRDNGSYRMASTFGNLVIPGSLLKITGRLRTRIIRDLRLGSRVITEIDANRIDEAAAAPAPEADV